MSTLFQALLSQSSSGQLLSMREVSRFSASEIRQTIAALVADQRMGMADALSAAGLSLYPDSEDVLAISALLAEMKQDWSTAEDLIRQLIAQQGDQVTAVTWRHLIRVLRCQCEPGQALQIAQQALQAYPNDTALQAERLALFELVSDQTPAATPQQRH
jgi:hypothetical protein